MTDSDVLLALFPFLYLCAPCLYGLPSSSHLVFLFSQIRYLDFYKIGERFLILEH